MNENYATYLFILIDAYLAFSFSVCFLNNVVSIRRKLLQIECYNIVVESK